MWLPLITKRMSESDNLSEPTHQVKQRFWDKVGDRCIAINAKSLKKLPSAWYLRDYLCEACGKTFTQCHSLHRHRKYHCKRLETKNSKRMLWMQQNGKKKDPL